jgi:anti-sigma factor RsiW
MNSSTYECEHTLLVQAEFDGELDAAQAAKLAPHREQCPHCQAVQEQLTRSRDLMRTVPRHVVSPDMKAQILERMREADAANASSSAAVVSSLDAERERRANASERAKSRGGSSGASRWRFGAGWGVAVAASLLAAIVVLRPRSPDVGAQLVNNHLRAMQFDSHLIDVVSTDHHTVKPWFAGKVDFAPPVKQLDREGYVLKGGRVDIVDTRPAAVLVYQAGRHVVDVYIWPASSGGATLFREKQVAGFNLRHWEEGGLTIWCVSDMGAEELDRFATQWRAAS